MILMKIGIVMDGCSILGRSIRTQLAMVNISVSIVIPDRTNGELGFELMASKPNQPLWQYLIDKSDTEVKKKKKIPTNFNFNFNFLILILFWI